MRIEGKKYVIATKKYPILFNDENNNKTDYFEDAELYKSENEAKIQLSGFDDDCIDEWCVIPVDITYDF